MKRIVVYDAEIEKAIPSKKNEQPRHHHGGVAYCRGWTDFENMGIACLCAYDYLERRYRVFLQDNLHDFRRLMESAELAVGFNNRGFDNHLLKANGIEFAAPSYDLLLEIWRADGLDGVYDSKTHKGFSLNAMVLANFAEEKNGSGDLAPVLWQRGARGKVIDYCLNDVRLTKLLFDRVLARKPLRHPQRAGDLLRLRYPAALIQAQQAGG